MMRPLAAATTATCIALAMLLLGYGQVAALNCQETLSDKEITYINWPTMDRCLAEVNGEGLPKDTRENIWRLIKNIFGAIDNITPDVYRKLGLTLTAIPNDELRNISMTQVEIVEAFGNVHGSETTPGFSDEQLTIIAQKIRNEWLGKNPKTYSEYDLISMGEVVCYLNVSDIEAIHADAFKEAAESIGVIKNCPQQSLEALAKLATHTDAFGEPKDWSKLEVSIMGNILNGLSGSEIASIDKDKLLLNRFYGQQQNASNTTTTADASAEGSDSGDSVGGGSGQASNSSKMDKAME